MSAADSLVCPKCQGAMRTYERSGVSVDQCTECRGIFLDRGELERLVDAEAAGLDGTAATARTADADPDPRRRERTHDDHDRERDDHDRDRDDHDRDRDDHDRDRDDEGRRGGPRGRPTDPTGRRRESRFGGLLDLFGGE